MSTTKPMINMIPREPAPEQIVKHFRKEIQSGALPPGTVLPSLRDLSEKLYVDINHVRDAMELLREEHLVKTNPGIGTTVLAENEWKRVAVLFPDTEFGHWNSIYKEIEYFMNVKGWKLELFPHHGQLELMRQHLRTVANGDYAGMIFALPMALLRQDDEPLGELLASGFPMVSVGGGLNCWTVDDRLYECGYWGTKYLIDQKYKKIAFVGCRSYNGEVFIDGCRRALEEASLDDFGTGYAEDVEFAIKIVTNWLNLEKQPDAIFYQRSVHGRHCFQLMQAKGVEIGPQIGFMALDDTTFHRVTAPSPCVVRRRPERLGQKAVEFFLELVRTPRKERILQVEQCNPKRYEVELSIQPGRSACGRKKRNLIYHAVNPIPTVEEQLLEYYPPCPPMPPGYWDGFNQG